MPYKISDIRGTKKRGSELTTTKMQRIMSIKAVRQERNQTRIGWAVDPADTARKGLFLRSAPLRNATKRDPRQDRTFVSSAELSCLQSAALPKSFLNFRSTLTK